ncbi:M48 family metallopeptidase [Desulfovibrio aminophilus]|uniref:M48 family metallopeptidase n=1 Tax=Desulfovibrio aminophilus TaxID=81425 RepID=UPI0004064D2C|nr:M48 family metallopeptidase [Desulfovibrio aminophilus]
MFARHFFFFLPLLILSCALAACAPRTSRPTIDPKQTADEVLIQKELVARDYAERERRLHRVAAPLLMRNADLCGDKVKGFTGLYVAQRDAFEDEWRSSVSKIYGLDGRIHVVEVLPDTPAERVGVRVGDVVLALDGTELTQNRKGLYRFQEAMEDQADKGAFSLTLERDGARQEVRVTPVPACDYPVVFEGKEEVNAYATGTHILITKGMVRFCGKDDELAVAMAHELAHNTMGHIDAQAANRMAGTAVDAVFAVLGVRTNRAFTRLGDGAFSQEFEHEADYVGQYYAARAGFDISVAGEFWRRMAVDSPEAITESYTHPTTPERYVALEAARAEIERKKALGEPLVPEMKPSPSPAEPAKAETKKKR